jgi:hypothetical protein
MHEGLLTGGQLIALQLASGTRYDEAGAGG